MQFDVAGPYEITRHGSKQIITKDSRLDLQSELDEEWPGLKNACGCYIFGKRAGGGIIPWYVGKAGRRPLLNESLNPSNITNYNKVLDKKGTPVMFLLPVVTPQGKLRNRPSGGNFAALDFLERWLIAEALSSNPNLINSKETRFLRNIRVVGLLNPEQGESTAASSKLRKALR